MRYTSCPDCDTGWRYADEVPEAPMGHDRHGLAPCPTCHGTGRLVRRDDAAPLAARPRAS